MPDQKLSTTLQLDAALTSGYKEAFSSASDLMADLKKEGNDLRKELRRIGREADEVEKVGDSADSIRRDMRLLERQIEETTRATERFGNAKRHFRSASIGARAFRSDIGAIATTARNAALAIAGIGTAAAIALSPSEELQQFDQTLAAIAFTSPEIDTADIERAKMDIRELSNVYGVTAAEIAMQHRQLTRNLGFDAAQQTIGAAVEFQAATGLAIAEIEEELATARISLGIDTSGETREFLELLAQAHAQGIKIDNIDLGDLETLVSRTGEDVFGENFQREFLTTIAFRQVDSFQFADYAQAFQEEFGRAVTAAPQVDLEESFKETMRVGENLAVLERFGLRAEDGILGAMRAFQQLSDTQRSIFREQLSPVLGEETVEIIGRGSEALPRITQQVDAILMSERGLTDAAEEVSTTWSGVWNRIGITGSNALGILQEQFASTFGPSLLNTATRLFDYLSANQQRITDLFAGVRDTLSPIIRRIGDTIRAAYPIVKEFVTDVWAELRRQFGYIAPAASAVGSAIMDIARAIGGFLQEHPRLVATVITGVAAWKAYQFAAGGVGVIANIVGGMTNLVGGHIHRLNAVILENARVSGTIQSASLGVSKVLGGIGKAALGTIPGISVMGGSLIAAIAPALPVILPVIGAIAAIGAAAYVVYRNWEPIKAFFVDNFETIRTALLVVFPPLGLMVSFADIIRQNWSGIKEFFSEIWETIKLSTMIAFEAIKFVALNAVLAVKSVWRDVGQFFAGIWSAIHDFFVASPLAPVFSWMVDGIKAVVAPLADFFSNFWDNIAEKAGEVLGWITDKVKAFNDILQSALGWLRDRNDEITEELNVTSNAEIGVADIPNAQMDAPEIGALEVGDAPTIDSAIASPDISMPDMPGVELPDSASPAINVTTPRPEGTRINLPMQRSPELANIGLGQLAEARKQTLLLEAIEKKESEYVREMVAPTEVSTPTIGDMGTSDQVVETTERVESETKTELLEIHAPIIEMPEVVVIAEPIIEAARPQVETEVITPSVVIDQPEVIDKSVETIKEPIAMDMEVPVAREIHETIDNSKEVVGTSSQFQERDGIPPADRYSIMEVPSMEVPEVIVESARPQVEKEIVTPNVVIDQPEVIEKSVETIKDANISEMVVPDPVQIGDIHNETQQAQEMVAIPGENVLVDNAGFQPVARETDVAMDSSPPVVESPNVIVEVAQPRIYNELVTTQADIAKPETPAAMDSSPPVVESPNVIVEVAQPSIYNELVTTQADIAKPETPVAMDSSPPVVESPNVIVEVAQPRIYNELVTTQADIAKPETPVAMDSSPPVVESPNVIVEVAQPSIYNELVTTQADIAKPETPAAMDQILEIPSPSVVQIESTPQVAVEKESVERVDSTILKEQATATPVINVQEATLPNAPPVVELQEYEIPADTHTIERERIEERRASDDGGAQNAPAANVTVNFTINQTPGQDADDLARVIMQKINESTETFLIQ